MKKKEAESFKKHNQKAKIALNVTHSMADTCDFLFIGAPQQLNQTHNATALDENSCECEQVKKKICIFKNVEPAPIPGSKSIYEGCFKMGLDVTLDKNFVCQAIRFCAEKNCDAIFHDGNQISFIKCYYGELPVKKADFKKQLFTLSNSC